MAVVAARITSPSTISVNRPYRSAMCSGCQRVIGPARSAQIGTAMSSKASGKNAIRPAVSGSASRSSQSTCTTETPTAYRTATARRDGSSRAARNHCATSGIRMIT